MKNILLIYHGWGIGGGLIAMIGLVQELKKQYNIRVLCIYKSEAVEYIKNEGIEVEVMRSVFYKKFYSLFIHSAASYFSIQHSIKKIYALLMYLINEYIIWPSILKSYLHNVDIVYLNSLFLTDWARAAKKHQKQVVLHVREPLSQGIVGYRRSLILHRIKRYVDNVIAISKDNAHRLIGIKNVYIIYDPVVTVNREFSYVNSYPNLKYFVYVGGEQRIKGFEQLVLSLEYLKSNIRIFFLGNVHNDDSFIISRLRRLLSPYYRRLPLLREKLLKSDKVIYVGSTCNVFSYYRKAIAIISPFSKPHASLPILEALSIGKPVIASNIAGTDEIISEEVGIIFQNGNYRELADCINRFSLCTEEQLYNYTTSTKLRYKEIERSSCSILEVLKNDV